MKMLVVDCCIRGEESRTKKLYEAFLENIRQIIAFYTTTVVGDRKYPFIRRAIHRYHQHWIVVAVFNSIADNLP